MIKAIQDRHQKRLPLRNLAKHDAKLSAAAYVYFGGRDQALHSGGDNLTIHTDYRGFPDEQLELRIEGKTVAIGDPLLGCHGIVVAASGPFPIVGHQLAAIPFASVGRSVLRHRRRSWMVRSLREALPRTVQATTVTRMSE